jgi:hypothetical protein
VTDIQPAMRADLDQGLAGAVEALTRQAAEYDGADIIEASVDLTNELLALFSPGQLAAGAAALALHLRRRGDTGRG